jgi:hypothetical protein
MLWCTTISICSKAVTPWNPQIPEGANDIQKCKNISNVSKSYTAVVQNAQNFFKPKRAMATGI